MWIFWIKISRNIGFKVKTLLHVDSTFTSLLPLLMGNGGTLDPLRFELGLDNIDFLERSD